MQEAHVGGGVRQEAVETTDTAAAETAAETELTAHPGDEERRATKPTTCA